ncbi:MAG: glycine cleavage system aminomethyltransferase GcvT [Verrucomicrobiota bacterium]|nr:glycine cleavage system aminomethyltransferase GcvT [Verrucomicrobiota bacterium]
MLKRTPLFALHQQLGARLVEFGGWEMPVQYSSIMDEHQAVRTAAGIFDICHMGEVYVQGKKAGEFLNYLLTNDIKKLGVNDGQYSLMCNDKGGVIDDLYVYRVAAEGFLLIINASRIEPDVAWMQQQLAAWDGAKEVMLSNESDRYGAIAIQGPAVAKFIDSAFQLNGQQGPSALKKNQLGFYKLQGEEFFVGRTGYTGEDGFELVGSADKISTAWVHLLDVGRPYGLKPAGLGARDTLRTEVCYPLYGHELTEEITPIEAGVGFFVSLDKGPFIGRERLALQKSTGISRKCIAFKMADKAAPPRPGYPIWSGGNDSQKIGEVVSGTQSPSLGIGIGLGYVPPDFSKPGSAIEIEVRTRKFPATVVQKPIYRKPD